MKHSDDLISDTDLLKKMANGSRESMTLFFNRHHSKVFSFAKKKGLTNEQANDIIQIVFMQMYRKKHLYLEKYSPMAWLYIITKSETKDYINREKKNHDLFLDHLSQTDTVTPNEEVKEQINKLMNTLNDKEKIAVSERYLLDKEFSEIAETLCTTEINIRKIISRAIKKMGVSL